jgi:tRNA pseudouridine13 synthase
MTMAGKFDLGSLPRLNELIGSALVRAHLTDFQVKEILGFKPTGVGEHFLVEIRKRNQNTNWIAKILADLAGIGINDIGYCGLKDRIAETTQWFSLYLPKRQIGKDQLRHHAFEVLNTDRHSKKLRRGDHKGNVFNITLRETTFDRHVFRGRLNKIGSLGVPNYFGEQRFGINGNNLCNAEKLIKRGSLKGNRQGSGFYLSAARSWLFNLILASHVQDHRNGEAFPFAQTGPLWGRGRSKAEPCMLPQESKVLANWSEWCYALEHAGLSQERRKLIVVPSALSYEYISSDNLIIKFELPRGCYATVVLREIAQLNRPRLQAL